MRASGRVYVRKRKREDLWYLQYRVAGRRFHRRLGPVWKGKGRPPDGYYTARQATDALQAILTDARRGELPFSDSVHESKTYADACADWLRYVETEKGNSPSTGRDYSSTVNRRLLPGFGKDTPVASITTADIDAFREKLLAEGRLSRRSIQKALVVNYGILKRAKRRGWIPTNPAEDAERVTTKRSGDFNVLSPEEVFAVSRAAADEQETTLILVAAFTGLRMGELLALRWGDVDFGKRTVFVRQNRVRRRLAKPKSGKIRSVPLIDQAAKALDALSKRDNFTEPSDLVFVTDTGTFIEDKVTRHGFYAALKKAGLGHLREKDDPIVFHDLRHTFGTLAVQVWPLVDVQSYMGHSNIQTTMIYAHHVPKHDAADALTGLVGRVLDAAAMEEGRSEAMATWDAMTPDEKKAVGKYYDDALWDSLNEDEQVAVYRALQAVSNRRKG